MYRTHHWQVRKWTQTLLNGYIQHDRITKSIDEYIVPSTFQDKAGIVGCLTLAHIAHEHKGRQYAGAGRPTATSVCKGRCNVGGFLCSMSKTVLVIGVGALVAVNVAGIVLKARKNRK